jgi:hypothetical protein
MMILCIALSYGFSIDEIPFKAAIGAAFGISVGFGGGIAESAALFGAQNGGKAIIEKTITETGEKIVNKAIEETAKTS